MTAEELRAWRALHRLTQRQLADRLGMSVSRIVDYERGIARRSDRSGAIPRVVALALKGLEQEMVIV